jgi:hypothetical protein
MKTLTLRGHVRADGILDLRIPTGMPESDVEVTVQVRKTGQGAEGRSWPEGFFERTAGAFRDDPIERHPHGDDEIREEIV